MGRYSARATAPPASAQVDWSSPLADGLRHCWLFSTRGGVRVPNLAQPIFPGSLFAQGALLWSPIGLQLTGGNSAWVEARGFAVADVTFSARIIGTRIASASTIALLYKSNNNVDAGCWIDYRENGGNYELGMAVVGAANARAYTRTGIPPLGQRLELVCTYAGGTAATALRVFLDGTEVTSYHVRTGLTGAHASDLAQPCMFGVSSAGTANAVPSIFRYESVMLWNRAISAAEVAALRANPYGMLR
jgi:hypothetical protein